MHASWPSNEQHYKQNLSDRWFNIFTVISIHYQPFKSSLNLSKLYENSPVLLELRIYGLETQLNLKPRHSQSKKLYATNNNPNLCHFDKVSLGNDHTALLAVILMQAVNDTRHYGHVCDCFVTMFKSGKKKRKKRNKTKLMDWQQ